MAQEFSYMAVDRSALAASARAGDATAKRALGVPPRASFMLSGAQLGITVTGLLVGHVAEPWIGEYRRLTDRYLTAEAEGIKARSEGRARVGIIEESSFLWGVSARNVSAEELP